VTGTQALRPTTRHGRRVAADRCLASRIDPEGDPELEALHTLCLVGAVLDDGMLDGEAVRRQARLGHVEVSGGVVSLTDKGRKWIARACWAGRATW
jgi:hypothetical protein